VRKAGAAARQMLLAALGKRGASVPTPVHGKQSSHSRRLRRKLSYGELAKKRRASRPTKSPLKDPKKFKLVGKPTRRSTRRKRQMAKPFLDWM